MLPVTLIQKRNNDELALYFRRLTKPKQMDWQYVIIYQTISSTGFYNAKFSQSSYYLSISM